MLSVVCFFLGLQIAAAQTPFEERHLASALNQKSGGGGGGDSPTPAPTATRELKVLVLFDPRFVDTSDEAKTTWKMVHEKYRKAEKLSTIIPGAISAGLLRSYDVFVIPEQEKAPVSTELTFYDKKALSNWVEGGHVLILFGDGGSGDSGLINELFRHSVADYRMLPISGISAKLNALNAAGSRFQSGPATLPALNAIWAFETRTLPSNAKSLYSYTGSSWVSAFHEGSGIVFHIAYDFFLREDSSWKVIVTNAIASQLDIVVPPAPAPTSPPIPPREPIAVLMDPLLVDTSNEAARTKRIVALKSSSVTQITTYTTGDIAAGLLDGHEIFVVPELEKAPLLGLLSSADQMHLKSWVESGRLLIMMGDNHGRYTDVLNTIFGLHLTRKRLKLGMSPSVRTVEAGMIGTFRDAPLALADLNAVDAINASTLCTSSCHALYSIKDGSTEYATVALMRGFTLDGAIITLGYDFFLRDDPGGWNDILERSVEYIIELPTKAAPAPTPIPSMTAPPVAHYIPTDETPILVLTDPTIVLEGAVNHAVAVARGFSSAVSELGNFKAGQIAGGILGAFNVLLIPSQKVSFMTKMDTADVSFLRSWMIYGGLVVVLEDGKGYGADMVNTMSNSTIAKLTGTASGDIANLQSVANDSAFAGGPASLVKLSTIRPISLASSSPTEKLVPIYSAGYESWVTQVVDGKFRVYLHISYDFMEKNDAGWDKVLMNALASGGDIGSAPEATPYPTKFPTHFPTRAPSPFPTPFPSLRPTAFGPVDAGLIHALMVFDHGVVDTAREAKNTLEVARSCKSAGDKFAEVTTVGSIHLGFFTPRRLAAYNVIIIPEMEKSNLISKMNMEDRRNLATWVQDEKHVLIILGDASDNFLRFLNAIFGYFPIITHSALGSSRAPLRDAGRATRFASMGPSLLHWHNAIYGITATTLPPNGIPIYSTIVGIESSWVTLFFEGKGRIVHIGYDHYQGIRPGWTSVIHAAMLMQQDLTGALPSPYPTNAPTKFPTYPTPAGAPTFPPVAPLTLKVCVLYDGAIVDVSNEAAKTLSVVKSTGSIVTKLTSYPMSYFAANITKFDVLVVPEQERGALVKKMSRSDTVAIANWIKAGHVMIIHGDWGNHDSLLINKVLGTSVKDSSSFSSGFAKRDDAKAAGTRFVSGPSKLAPLNAVYGLKKASLPTGDVTGVSLYSNDKISFVSMFTAGGGRVFHLGYDYYEKFDPGWDYVTRAAVLTAADLSKSPVAKPTPEPTMPPTPFSSRVKTIMLYDYSIVDVSREAARTYAATLKMSSTVMQIGDYKTGEIGSGVLYPYDVFIIPEMERGNLLHKMNANDVTVLQGWISSGGVMIVVGDSSNHATEFLNIVFGYKLSPLSPYYGGVAHKVAANAKGTRFEYGPETLPYLNAIFSLSISSLPTVAKTMYKSSGYSSSSEESSWVTLFTEDHGKVVHIAYDFYEKDSESWETIVLESMRLAVDIPSRYPIPSPTPYPTEFMTPKPTTKYVTNYPTPRPTVNFPTTVPLTFPPVSKALLKVLVLYDKRMVDVLREAKHTKTVVDSACDNIELIEHYIRGSISTGLLHPYDVFVIPEQERAPFVSLLTPWDQIYLKRWVRGGKVLLTLGDAGTHHTDLINGVFGHGVLGTWSDEPYAIRDEMSVEGTRFSYGPRTIGKRNAIFPLQFSTLPDTARSMYRVNVTQSWVTVFYEGHGRVVHSAYDYYQKLDDGWDQIIYNSINTAWDIRLPSVPTTDSPSFIPTTYPTPNPTNYPGTAPPVGPKAHILMLYDGSIVDTDDHYWSGRFSEGHYTKEVLMTAGKVETLMNYTERHFSKPGLLDLVDVISIPEMEKGSLYARMTGEDLVALQAWVESGRILIVNGDSHNHVSDLINAVAGLSVEEQGAFTTMTANRDISATGTRFTRCPKTLTYRNAVWGLSITSLPPSAKPIFHDSEVSWVTLFTFGRGKIVHVGYDFFLGRSSSWDSVLREAVFLAHDSDPTPIAAPTRFPTQLPTRSGALIPCAVLLDPRIVDTKHQGAFTRDLADTVSETKNISHYSTGMFAHGITQFNWVLLIPSMTKGYSLNVAMSEEDVSYLVRWVRSGRVLIVCADFIGYDVKFLRNFGIKAKHFRGTSSGATRNEASAMGTRFVYTVPSLPYMSAVYPLRMNSLPTNARSIYSEGVTSSWVTTFPVGHGEIIHIAYNYFEGISGGWGRVMKEAIRTGNDFPHMPVDPGPLPTPGPTPRPSVYSGPTYAPVSKSMIKAAILADNAYILNGARGVLKVTRLVSKTATRKIIRSMKSIPEFLKVSDSNVFVIPEQTKASIKINPSQKDGLRHWVREGNVLITVGDPSSNSISFLNSVFEYSMAAGGHLTYDSSPGAHLDTVESAGTRFRSGAPRLKTWTNVFTITTASLPIQAKSLYHAGTQTWVTLINEGAGSVIYFGYDWNSDKAYGWDSVFKSAIRSVADIVKGPVAWPSPSPTVHIARAHRVGILADGMFVTAASESTESISEVARDSAEVQMIRTSVPDEIVSELGSCDVFIVPPTDGHRLPDHYDFTRLREWIQGGRVAIVFGDRNSYFVTPLLYLGINAFSDYSLFGYMTAKGEAKLSELSISSHRHMKGIFRYLSGPKSLSKKDSRLSYLDPITGGVKESLRIYEMNSSETAGQESVVTVFTQGKGLVVFIGYDYRSGREAGWDNVVTTSISMVADLDSGLTFSPSTNVLTQSPTTTSGNLHAGVLTDPKYLSVSGSELAIKSIVEANGAHTVDLNSVNKGFIAIRGLEDLDMLLIPPLVFEPDFGSEDFDTIIEWTRRGKTLVLFGDNSDEHIDFLNMFGYSMNSSMAEQPYLAGTSPAGQEHYCMADDESWQDCSPFEEGPLSLPYAENIFPLTKSKLPETAKSMYTTKGYTDTTTGTDDFFSWVTVFYEGNGAIVHVGYDYTRGRITAWDQMVVRSMDLEAIIKTRTQPGNGGGAEGKKKNVGAIVGGTLGGLAGAVILIAAGVWMYKRYKASNPYAPMENDLDHDDHQDELHQPLQDDGPPLSEIGPEISVAEDLKDPGSSAVLIDEPEV